MVKKYPQYANAKKEDGYKRRLMLWTKKDLWTAVQIIKSKKDLSDLNTTVIYLIELGLTTLSEDDLRGLKNVIKIN